VRQEPHNVLFTTAEKPPDLLAFNDMLVKNVYPEHVCDPRTQEVEAEDRKFKGSLGYPASKEFALKFHQVCRPHF
jgi:hypothetical protein